MATSGSSTTADRLAAAGERVTEQRLAIAAALAAAGRQVSAAQLYDSIRRSEPPIGRATVFRTLERLVEAGVARRLDAEGRASSYVACQPEHHHHLSCSSCGGVEEIPESWVAPLARRATRELGFEIEDARLDFYGRCRRCRKG